MKRLKMCFPPKNYKTPKCYHEYRYLNISNYTTKKLLHIFLMK